MIWNYIPCLGFSYWALGSIMPRFIAITPGLPWFVIQLQFKVQINLFENYLNSIGILDIL